MTVSSPDVIEIKLDRLIDDMRLLRSQMIAFDMRLNDPPPLKWSDLRYVFDIQEDCNGKEAIQA